MVHGAKDVDVLLIIGMRDEAPVAALSRLVPDSRLLEIRVQANAEARWARQGGQDGVYDGDIISLMDNGCTELNPASLNWQPTFTFDNEKAGDEAPRRVATDYLLPFFDEGLQRLSSMRPVSEFPRPEITFRHVLDISQQPGGLRLCTSLLQTHFTGDWNQVDAIACCEASGFVYASALASQIDVRLALIREAGKLPPATISVAKATSYISPSASSHSKQNMIEMERDVVPTSGSVVVVDDILATGKTLCAVLQLMGKAGISLDRVSVLVVVEFPLHRGRQLLRQSGFGNVNIHNLLLHDGV